MDSHRCLKSRRKERFGFFTVPTGPTTINFTRDHFLFLGLTIGVHSTKQQNPDSTSSRSDQYLIPKFSIPIRNVVPVRLLSPRMRISNWRIEH
jgi:hypothetical protein